MKKRNIIIAIFFGILAIAGAIGGFFYNNKNVIENPTIKEHVSEPIQCLYGCPMSKKKEKVEKTYKRKYITLSKKRG